MANHKVHLWLLQFMIRHDKDSSNHLENENNENSIVF